MKIESARRSRFAAALAIAALSSCSQQNSVAFSQNFATRLTSGEFCSNSDVVVRLDTLLPALYVSAHPLVCSFWPRSIPGVTIISGRARLAGYDAPIIVYFKSTGLFDALKSPKRIFVRVAGGPGLPIGPFGFERSYMNGFGRDDVMVAVGYAGTSYGSLYPSENFTKAVDQVAELINRLQARSPDAEIYLIGESLGGPIAIESVAKLDSGIKPRIVLVSPMIDSLYDQLKHIRSNIDQTTFQESKFPIKVFSQNLSLKHIVTQKSVNSELLLSNFFPVSERDVSILTRLQASRIGRDRLLVFVGDKDRSINRSGVNELAKLYAERVISVRGMGHGISDSGATQIEREIAAFIGERR